MASSCRCSGPSQGSVWLFHVCTITLVFVGGLFSWLYNGSQLEVFSTQSGERVAAWCFGLLLKDPTTTICCCVECEHQGNRSLILATDSVMGNTLIMFDVVRSRVAKVIQMPYKVRIFAKVILMPYKVSVYAKVIQMPYKVRILPKVIQMPYKVSILSTVIPIPYKVRILVKVIQMPYTVRILVKTIQMPCKVSFQDHSDAI